MTVMIWETDLNEQTELSVPEEEEVKEIVYQSNLDDLEFEVKVDRACESRERIKKEKIEQERASLLI